MTLDDFYAATNGQSVLYAPGANPESLRGQCVQLASAYVNQVWHKGVIWDNAYGWFADGRLTTDYDRFEYPKYANPPRGALIIWGPDLPGSDGYGHIGILWQPGQNTFISFDTNWGGKTAHLVTHNWSYVVGWMVPKGTLPSPAPESDEMIKTTDEAAWMYHLLRPNYEATQDEINVTVGKRTFHDFVENAKAEVYQRDSIIRQQTDQLAGLQATINQLNTTVTNLQKDDNADKATVQAGVQKIAELTTELEAAHDRIADLQKTPTPPTPEPTTDQKVSWVVKLIAAMLGKKTKA